YHGLNGTVDKSQGSADATGDAAANHLAFQHASSSLSERLAARVAQAGGFGSADENEAAQ
ncbi:MAG: phosphate acyltransferase, partial [Pseudomonadota bacterium]